MTERKGDSSSARDKSPCSPSSVPCVSIPFSPVSALKGNGCQRGDRKGNGAVIRGGTEGKSGLSKGNTGAAGSLKLPGGRERFVE